jgi:hypothetical protein
MEKDEQLAWYHSKSILNTDEWWKQARSLMVVARVLRPAADRYFKAAERQPEDVACLNAFFMLAAFALENALKAYLVRETASDVSRELANKKQLPSRLRTHDLLTLARLVQIPIANDVQIAFLRRMSRYAKWAGRYPAPVSASDCEAPSSITISKKWVLTHSYESQDLFLSEKLFTFLEYKWDSETVTLNGGDVKSASQS